MERDYNAVERLLTLDTDMLWRLAGLYVRLSGKTSAGRFVMKQVGTLSGAAIARAGLFEVERMEEPEDVMGEWTKVLEELGCNFEPGEAAEDGAELFMLECPAGLTESDGRAACLAGMSADLELVKRLGGELIIGETIATGEDRCHLRVVRPGGG